MNVRPLIVLALALAACGGRSSSSGSPTPSPAGDVTTPPPASSGGDPAPPTPTTVSPGAREGLALDPAARFALPPLQTSLPAYELEIPDAALQAFAADLYAPEQPATFRAGGKSWPVMVRLRGASSRTFPKKSWNVDFGAGARFDGRRRLNLIAEYQDATMMVEKLAYDLLAAMGVRAPLSKYVTVTLNGRYQGVFLDLEQVDKSFLPAHGFTDTDATIWRCGWKDCEFMTRAAKHDLALLRLDGGYQEDWNLKTNETEPRAPIDAALDGVLHVMNHAPEPSFPDDLARRFALEPYLRALAVDALLSNNYVEDSESYFVHDRAEDRWFYVPWDLNNVDARYWPTYPIDDEPKVRHPMVGFSLFDGRTLTARYAERSPLYPNYRPVFSNLATRVVLHPGLRERLLALVERGLDEVFSSAVLDGRIDAMYALVSPAMHRPTEPVPVAGAPADFLDPTQVDLAKFERGPWYVKTFVARRIPILRAELARLRAWRPELAIEAVDPRAGWVELSNRGAAAIALGGRTLTPRLRDALLANLPARTLAPGERVRFTAAELGIALPADGELGLFDGVSRFGLHDALFYGALPAGKAYARDAAGAWTVR